MCVGMDECGESEKGESVGREIVVNSVGRRKERENVGRVWREK